MLQPIWEGLARERWTAPEIAQIQKELTRVKILEAYAPAMRMERALALREIERVRTIGFFRKYGDSRRVDAFADHLVPGAIFSQNQLSIAGTYDDHILPAVDSAKHYVDVDRAENASLILKRRLYHPYAILANLGSVKTVAKSAQFFACGQAAVDLAILACALERYRLATGCYPEALDALKPYFVPQIPPDVITGKPLQYRVTDERFVLYSVGLNKTDEHGVVAVTPMNHFDPSAGDWVWQYPAEVAAQKGASESPEARVE
jgi:hypothetical protein